MSRASCTLTIDTFARQQPEQAVTCVNDERAGQHDRRKQRSRPQQYLQQATQLFLARATSIFVRLTHAADVSARRALVRDLGRDKTLNRVARGYEHGTRPPEQHRSDAR